MATDTVDMFHFWKQVELSVLEKASDASWNTVVLDFCVEWHACSAWIGIMMLLACLHSVIHSHCFLLLCLLVLHCRIVHISMHLSRVILIYIPLTNLCSVPVYAKSHHSMEQCWQLIPGEELNQWLSIALMLQQWKCYCPIECTELTVLFPVIGYVADSGISAVPKYDFWAPWLAPSSITGPEVLNTEYKKCPEYRSSSEAQCDNEKELSEEFLIELLCESQVSCNMHCSIAGWLQYLSTIVIAVQPAINRLLGCLVITAAWYSCSVKTHPQHDRAIGTLAP